MPHPFDCITDLIFVESKDNWFLFAEGINRVMKEVEKIGKYFAAHIPRWVE